MKVIICCSEIALTATCDIVLIKLMLNLFHNADTTIASEQIGELNKTTTLDDTVQDEVIFGKPYLSV